MLKSRPLAVWTTALTLLTGCAWVPQKANLQLTPRVAPSHIGNGITVFVRAVDKRSSKTIGHRGLDSKNAAITSEQDVAELFRQKIIEGLVRKGFNAMAYAEKPGRVLTVEIREISYTTDLDFWKGIVQAKAVLRAAAIKDGMTFEQVYSGEREGTAIEAPRARTNERLINGAMSDAVQRLLEDERLGWFLAN